jgi:putative transposase
MLHEPGRQSLRLQSYDYTQPADYHAILATQQGRHLFGSVVESEMRLNLCGQIAQEALLSLSERFSNVEIDDYVIMPNHIHALFRIKELPPDQNPNIDQMPTRFQSYWRKLEREESPPGAVPLYEVIRSFKALTSYHERRKGNTPSFAWHSGYYERIITENERFLYNVRRYIHNNPIKWEQQQQEWKAAGFRWTRIPYRQTH